MPVPKAQTMYTPAPPKAYNERAANAPIGYKVEEIPVNVNTPIEQAPSTKPKPAYAPEQEKYASPYGAEAPNFVHTAAQRGNSQRQTDWSDPSNYLDYLKGANPAAYKEWTSYVDIPRYKEMVAEEIKQQRAVQRKALAEAQASTLIWGNKGILGF